jgi:hypothetical protein
MPLATLAGPPPAWPACLAMAAAASAACLAACSSGWLTQSGCGPQSLLDPAAVVPFVGAFVREKRATEAVSAGLPNLGRLMCDGGLSRLTEHRGQDRRRRTDDAGDAAEPDMHGGGHR